MNYSVFREPPDVVLLHRHIVLLDGVCNLCAAFLGFLYRRDHGARLRFCWVQSATGREILRWAGLSVESFDTLLYVQAGVPLQKSTAFLNLVRQLRFPWTLLVAGFIIPRPLRDWIYDQVSRNRYRLFGRKSECMVPDGDIRSRFIGQEVSGV